MLLAVALASLLPAAGDLPQHFVVLGPDDVPVAGAEIVLDTTAVGSWDLLDREVLAEGVTDADGRAVIPIPQRWIDGRGERRWIGGVVRADGYAMHSFQWQPDEVPGTDLATVRLEPDSSEGVVRVVDTAGEPLEGVRVFPIQIGLRSGDAPISLTRHTRNRWGVKTDADGRAVVPVDLTTVNLLGVTGDNIGEQRLQLDGQEGPIEFEVHPTAPRRLVFEGERPVGCAVDLEAWSPMRFPDGSMKMRSFHGSARVDADEEQAVLALTGYAPALLVSDGPLALRYASVPTGLDAPFSATPIQFALADRTIRASGRIVSGAGDVPVAGATVHVQALHRGTAVTDADGRYEVEVHPDARFVNVFGVDAPDGYFPYGSQSVSVELTGGEADVQVEDILLHRSWSASGRALLHDGSPADGAWIVAEQMVPHPRGYSTSCYATAVCDEDGTFTLDGLAVGTPARLVAKSGLFSGRATLHEGEASVEVELGLQLAAYGTVRGRDGDPVTGVELRLIEASRPGISGGEEVVPLGGSEFFTTDAEGSFRSPTGIDPDRTYCVQWRGDGVTIGQTDWLDGETIAAGLDLEVNPRRPIAGRLVDHRGAVVAGASLVVRSTGETATTADDGAFGLARVSLSGDVVLVDLSNGRSTWIVLEPGAESDTWTLRAPPVAVAESADDDAARRRIAAELLAERLQRTIDAGDDGYLLRAVRRYAWADPAGAMERVEAGMFEVAWQRDFSLAYVTDALLALSPDEALTVAHTIDRGMSQGLKILKVARELDADAELEQLSLLRAKARAIDPPEHRVVVLARLADRLLDLRMSAAAASVLEEAQEVAATLPNEEWPSYARSCLGEILCRVDLDAGRALIDSMSETENIPRHLGRTAIVLAEENPEAAEAMLGEMEGARGAWRVERYAPKVAYAMASFDLERARRIASTYDRTGQSDALIARALAESGAALDEARASLETALELASSEKDVNGLLLQTQIGVRASIVEVAALVDPDELEWWISRVLAFPRPKDGWSAYVVEDPAFSSDGAVAWHVARFDPELARTLVVPALDAMTGRSEYHAGSVSMVWATAALIDAEWAAEHAARCGDAPMDIVGQILAMPPEARDAHVRTDILRLSSLGDLE